MNKTTTADRCRGVLLGLAAGDRNGGPIRMAVLLAESLLELGRFDPQDTVGRYLRWWREGERSAVRTALGHYQPMRALNIRQPHAEAILRGVKKVEYRSAPTHIRGCILVYAALGRYPEDEEAEMMAEYGIKDVTCDDLPRGVLVGSVELHDCDGGEWHLRNPVRAEKPVQPKNQPQPVWFHPF